MSRLQNLPCSHSSNIFYASWRAAAQWTELFQLLACPIPFWWEQPQSVSGARKSLFICVSHVASFTLWFQRKIQADYEPCYTACPQPVVPHWWWPRWGVGFACKLLFVSKLLANCDTTLSFDLEGIVGADELYFVLSIFTSVWYTHTILWTSAICMTI